MSSEEFSIAMDEFFQLVLSFNLVFKMCSSQDTSINYKYIQALLDVSLSVSESVFFFITRINFTILTLFHLMMDTKECNLSEMLYSLTSTQLLILL